MCNKLKLLSLLGLILLLGSGAAFGTTITFESGGGTTLDGAGLIPAEIITAHPAWDPAAGVWVSNAQTGDPSLAGWVENPSGTTPFFHSFLSARG